MKPRKILAPIDFSERSRAALAHADSMAVQSDADLELLHVHQIVEVAVLDFTYVERPEAVAEVVEAAEKELGRWAASLTTPAKRLTTKVVTGSPVEEIVKASKDFDLIVMATHGRTGISHFLLGSVAERIVQGAACSVLVIKEPRDSSG